MLRFNRYGASTTGSRPTAHSVQLDCMSGGLSQRLSTQINDFDGTHPATLARDVGSSLANLEMTVVKDGRGYTYDGGASSVARSWGPSKVVTLTFSGSYSYVGDDPTNANLPQYGRFRAEVTLDCAALSVVTQSLVFEIG